MGEGTKLLEICQWIPKKTVDMGKGGVKKQEKRADVFYAWPYVFKLLLMSLHT